MALPAEKNRRKYPRVEVEIAADFEQSGETQIQSTTTRNIGAGGLSVDSDRPLPVNAQAQIYLKLPDNQPPFVAMAKVCWCQQKKRILNWKADVYQVGLEYEDLDTAQVNRLVRFTQEFSP